MYACEYVVAGACVSASVWRLDLERRGACVLRVTVRVRVYE